jgi:hypothetical protein
MNWKFVNLQDVERQPGMLRRVRQLMRWSTSFWYFRFKIQNPGLGEYLSLGWVITEELESCVCSSKRRSWSLYRRSGSERKRRITTTTSRHGQTDGMCQMIPPMNEGESSSRVCPPPPPPPTYRPADRQTHKPTETHTRKRGASSSALRMRRKEIKSRRCVRAFSSPLFFLLPPNNLPAWDPKHKNNSDAGPCNIRREYRQWADASSHRQRQKMDFPSDILVSYNHTRNGLAKSYITRQIHPPEQELQLVASKSRS